MFYLFLAILLSTSIVTLFKYFSKFKIDILEAISVNYLIATLFGILYYKGDVNLSTVFDQNWLFLAIIIGGTFILGFFIFALSAQVAGVAITGVSSRMSVVIPVTFSIIFFKTDEVLTPLKLVGILLVIISFYLILRKEKKVVFKKSSLILPLVLFLMNGANDTLIFFIKKVFITETNEITMVLNVIFGTAFLISVILILIRLIDGKVKLKLKNLFAGIILGLVNFGSTYFLFKSFETLQGTTVFPVLNVGIVALTALVGFFVFHEKLRTINWIGIIMAITAILVLAFSKM